MSRVAASLVPGRPGRPDWKKIGLLAGLVAFIALCGVGILILIGFNIGPVPLAVGVGAAIIPVPVLVAAFLWLDRYEPEPVKYLAHCFALGRFLATPGAVLLNKHARRIFH